MKTGGPALAKLTRPKIHDAIPRPRLFSLLDEAGKRPIVWVCAPPGAGKTTLVASFLEARGLRHIWYQVDIADSDPATFVHYMRMAALQLVGKKASALAHFNPEPQQDIARFARTYFREFFTVLPRPTVIVLDSFQEARTTPELRSAFAHALEEVPDGITVIAISRSDPPHEFARLGASRRVARIEPSALACTPDEAEAMLAGQDLDEQAVARITRQSNGWVAALVLLREHMSRAGATLDESIGEGKDAIFQYFAGEIFNRARPENQRVLMLTAVSPSFTPAEAVALTGSEDAAELLDYLYHRHLFTDRRRGTPTTYHYHVLFREFLLEEAKKRLSSAERRVAAAHAAELLSARGEANDALTLYRDAGDAEAMRRLIVANALEWARQGRAQTLSDWIEALPNAMRESDPWLQYWYGRAWIFVRPPRGRPPLERAYEMFRAAGDLKGQALALNTIVTGYYYEWANFAPLDRWLPEFDRLLDPAQAAKLDRESELRLRSAHVIALLFRRPEDPELAASAQRLDELIDGEADLNARMMAASTLFNYLNWTTKGDSADPLVARISPILSEPGITPLMQVWWRTHLSFWHHVSGRYEEAATVISEAREVAERYGLVAYLFEIDHAVASALISKGDYAAAAELLQAMQRRLSPSRRMDWAYFHHLQANLEQRLGHYGNSAKAAEQAVDLARETGLPSVQVPHFLARLAHSRISAGDREGGMRAMEDAIATASEIDRKTFEQQRELVFVDEEIAAGETERATRRLAAVLTYYRTRGTVVFLRNRPDLAARLANYALMHGIETEFVRMLIERNSLDAPADAAPEWPFRLRIRALGGFELTRDGLPMRFTGKAQQRPLDLLKLLVALGGSDVDTQRLMAALWPDADGDAAKASFDTTLFRLRKLLDIDRALVLSAGKLSLVRAVAWTDVGAFKAVHDAAEDASQQGRPVESAAHVARRLLDAYPGPLLGAEEHAWIAKPRDALRARFVRTLSRLGEHLERQGNFATAIDVYRRGLEADNLAESFYRGLMRSLASTGNQAEALNAFRRCRELLSIVLSVKPSPETDLLSREIAAGAFPRAFPDRAVSHP